MGIESFGESLLSGQRKRRKKQQKAETLGLVASLGTVFANKMLQNKAQDFLENEDYLNKKRQQQATYARGTAFRKQHETALNSVGGAEAYYTKQRYDQLVADYQRTYQKEDYKEGINGLLWTKAKTWAEEITPEMDTKYEKSFNIRTPEEMEAQFSKHSGPKNVLDWLTEKATGVFTNKDASEIRQERLDALEENMALNKADLKTASQSLGSGATIASIAGFAEKIKAYKLTKNDWITKSRSAMLDIPMKYLDGKSISIKAYKVKKAHPNYPDRTIETWEPVEGNTASIEGVKAIRSGQGVLGTTTETKEIDTGLGYKIKEELTYTYNADYTVGIARKNNIGKMTPSAPIAMNATQSQIAAASEQFKMAERSILGRDGKNVAEKVKFFINQGETEGEVAAQEKARANNLYRQVHAQGISAHSKNLNEDGVTLGLENSLRLSAITRARHIGSLIIEDEGRVYGTNQKDFDEVDFGDSTQLNHANFKSASSVYLLDAFYASSAAGGEGDVRLSKPQVSALAIDAVQSFGMLPAPARAVFLEFFNKHTENNKTSIFKETYQGPKGTVPTSFINHFLIIDQTLRASGS